MSRKALSAAAVLAVVLFTAACTEKTATSVTQGSTSSAASASPVLPAAPIAAADILVRPHSPVIGEQNAPVTLVEFFDPSCEACRAFYPVVKEILAKNAPEVRLVLRYTLFHEGSEQTARIMETARLQGVYEPVVAAVLEAQPQWHDDPNVAAAWTAAAAAGLDVEKARQQMNSPEIDAVLKTDMDDAKAVDIKGTPTFFVNGYPWEDRRIETFEALIADRIAAAKNTAK